MNTYAQIEAVLTAYYDSFQQQNWDKFAAFLDDDFTHYTDTCIIQPKREFVEFLRRNDWRVQEYGISAIHHSMSQDKSLAVVWYTITFTGVSHNTALTVRATETTVFGNNNGEWRILHCHSSNS